MKLRCFIKDSIRKSYIYPKEAVSCFFDKNSIRVLFSRSFIGNGAKSREFFMLPLKKKLEEKGKTLRFVEYFKPHIQFFGVFGPPSYKNKIKNSKAKYKIFFTGENINNSSGHYYHYKGACVDYSTLSMGFDYINASNYLRFPLWLLYFFNPLYTKDDIQKKLQEFTITYKKIKFCALIASHDASGLRTRILDLVSKAGVVDRPGRFMHNDDSLHTQFNNSKLAYLRQYYFNICPENSICTGYVTEKLFESLYSGCIPIYTGGGGRP
ncbi:MAG: hypothetical protein LBC53_06920 [Spirochaetaceae bacterium]|nr:hypothetical protein [Spirochaetaceae bacterium]